VLRKRRRERSLRRAAEQVGRGSVRSGSTRGPEVKSREWFVVDAKGEVLVDEEEVWEEEVAGRKGMSLPRRFW
jgi:hypothetical protein